MMKIKDKKILYNKGNQILDKLIMDYKYALKINLNRSRIIYA